jgi:hypothetical protein
MSSETLLRRMNAERAKLPVHHPDEPRSLVVEAVLESREDRLLFSPADEGRCPIRPVTEKYFARLASIPISVQY